MTLYQTVWRLCRMAASTRLASKAVYTALAAPVPVPGRETGGRSGVVSDFLPRGAEPSKLWLPATQAAIEAVAQLRVETSLLKM